MILCVRERWLARHVASSSAVAFVLTGGMRIYNC